MTACTLTPPQATPRPGPRWRWLVATLWARERRLTGYAAAVLALLLPMALAALLDDRLLRGAPVWIKPAKFAVSIAVLALTTAWFIGHLHPAQRRSRTVDAIVWLLIGSSAFELAYIALQAGLGQASHYAVGDPLHAAMYTLMGVGALALTATQSLLAWQLGRHPDPARPRAMRLAVRLGLHLSFALGAGAGVLLGSLQPPDATPGAALPLLGWALAGGDLRPAHFIGLHAAQVLPLAGWLLSRPGAVALSGSRGVRAPWRVPAVRAVRSMRDVWAVAVAYTALFGLALAWGLHGRVPGA